MAVPLQVDSVQVIHLNGEYMSHTLIQYVMCALAVLTLIVLEPLISHRLKVMHPDIFKELGSPQFGDSNLTRFALRRPKFMLSFEFLTLRDFVLNLLCSAAIFGYVSLLILLVIGFSIDYVRP